MSMEKCVEHSVIIIGAGPSGLALAHWLEKENIDYLILERSQAAGSSWRQMPDQLHLISKWPTNCLIPCDKKLFPKEMSHKAPAFSEYLNEFSKRFNLKIEFNVNVTAFKKENSEFVITTDVQSFKSKYLIDCRGYFNYPYFPVFPIVGSPPLMVHFKDYKNADQFIKHKKILIVGKRLSAGQVLEELSRAGNHELFLSAKSEIKFSSHPSVYNFFLSHLDFIENIIKKFKLRPKEEIEVPMHFRVKKIVEENVKITSVIKNINNNIVYFEDGSKQDIDAIIFTTGFRPPEVHLKNDFESDSTENLFYLGRGSQRSFTSRFIRGIRDDAPILARLISGRMAFKNKRQ